MRQITTLFLLFFVFILHEKGYAQTIDMSGHYIVSQSPLSAELATQIDYLIQDFNAELQAELVAKGYTILSDESAGRLHATQLYGHSVRFNAQANQAIFMRVLYDDTGRLSFINYFCDISTTSGIPTLDPLRAHTSSGPIGAWSNEGERGESIAAAASGLVKEASTNTFASEETFLGIPDPTTTMPTATTTSYTPAKTVAYTPPPTVVTSKPSPPVKTTTKPTFTGKKDAIPVVTTPRLTPTSVPVPSDASASNKKFVGH